MKTTIVKTADTLRRAALRRVADQEQRIAKQKTLINALLANGTNVAAAKLQLTKMQDTLATLRDSVRHYSI